MTDSQTLRTLAAELREHRLSLWAASLDRIAVSVARMERTLDEITAEAAESADNAERAARLAGSNVVDMRRWPGTDWTRRGEFER